jgi:hypothetical protein
MRPGQAESEKRLEDLKQLKQEKTDKVTRIVAIAFSFAAIYYFFIKLLFL